MRKYQCKNNNILLTLTYAVDNCSLILFSNSKGNDCTSISNKSCESRKSSCESKYMLEKGLKEVS